MHIICLQCCFASVHCTCLHCIWYFVSLCGACLVECILLVLWIGSFSVCVYIFALHWQISKFYFSSYCFLIILEHYVSSHWSFLICLQWRTCVCIRTCIILLLIYHICLHGYSAVSFFSALVCCISSGSKQQSAVWAAVLFSQLVWLLIPLMIHWVYNRWKSVPALRVISWMVMDVFVIHNNWCIKWLSWIHGKTLLKACICASITF